MHGKNKETTKQAIRLRLLGDRNRGNMEATLPPKEESREPQRDNSPSQPDDLIGRLQKINLECNGGHDYRHIIVERDKVYRGVLYCSKCGRLKKLEVPETKPLPEFKDEPPKIPISTYRGGVEFKDLL